MGRNEARSPGDDLHSTFHSLEDAHADPSMNHLSFSFCRFSLHLAGFAEMQEFSGEINLCSYIGRVKNAEHALKSNRC